MEGISSRFGQLIWSLFLLLGRKASGLHSHVITIRDCKYQYLISPAFDPNLGTVVLLHGFTGFKEYWSEFVRFSTAQCNFIAIDLPGHGKSDFDREVSFEQQGLDLINGILSRHHIEVVHLVGASVGAWVACLYALEDTRKVKSLTLIGPVGIPATSSSEFYDRVDEGKNPFWISTQHEYNYLLELALKNPPAQFWPLSNFLLADYLERKPIYKDIWEQITTNEQRVRSVDLEKLSRIPCRKLVVVGEKERTIDESVLQTLQTQVKGISVGKCPDSGHSVQCDQPRWLANQIDGFLACSS